MKKKLEKDLYIIVKSIMAKNVQEALRKDREASIVNVYMDDEWKKNKVAKTEQLGF